MKKVVFVLGLMVLVFGISGDFVVAKGGRNATIKGNVLGVILIERPKETNEHLGDIKEKLTPEFLKQHDWVETSFHYQKTVVLSGFLVSLDNGKLRRLTKTGTFSLSAEPGVHVVKIFSPDKEIVGTREVFIESNKSMIYLPIVLVNELKEDDVRLFKHGGPACLDYNGPLGSCKDYQSGFMKWWNFIGSDCDIAMSVGPRSGYCWNELMPGQDCNHGGKNCSLLIGHSGEAHCH